MKELDEYYEISGYNKTFFSWWIIPRLKMVKFVNKKDFLIVSELVIPLVKGCLSYYVNPVGFQVVYNILRLMLEMICFSQAKVKKWLKGGNI